jgi:phosphatidylglycerol:prolipoprotein diacylglycerol transferase
MHPELFGVVKSYGLMLAISFALGMWLSVRRARPRGIGSETVMDLVFGVLISSIIGVWALYVATHGAQFDPWYTALFIWDGGLTLYGGILAATATVWWMCRRRGIAFLDMADIFAPGVMLGIGLTRIGCFLAGCCFGKPTTCALAVHFPADAPASLVFGGRAVHPTQLYASAAGFAIFGLLLLAERLPSGRGATFGRFLALYGAARLVEDAFRYYEPGQVLAGLSNNQWVSVVLVAAGALVMVRARRSGEVRRG